MDVYLLSLPLARHRTIVAHARDLTRSVDSAVPEPESRLPEATEHLVLRHAFAPPLRPAR